MKKILFLMLLPLLAVACGGNKTANDTNADTLRTDTVADTTEVEETPPPEAVDKVFADFLYDFMRKPKFQAARVRFPLPVTTDMVPSVTNREQWVFTPLFAKQELYCNLFSGGKAEVTLPDSGTVQVQVKMLQRKQKRIKTYTFQRLTGTWMLTAMTDRAIGQNVREDFAAFFLRFATDFKFQQQHVADPFDISVLTDEGSRMDGIAMSQQWPDYAVEFPKGAIPFVDYSCYDVDNPQPDKKPKGEKMRTVQLTDGTMGCDLTFTLKKQGWMLTGLTDE